MKKIIGTCITILTIIIGTASADYFNGFETDLTGWQVFGGSYNPNRVASGSNGITSKTGNFHAEAATNGFPATNWGAYSSVFPTTGYVTSLDIYLNVDGGFANDKRFDFTSAINNASGSHRRDFAFNGGFYNDENLDNRFVFTASNNTGRSGAYPKDPGRNPIAITQTGWYTFQHTFYNNGGVLAVDLKIIDSSNTIKGSWTLSNTLDLIGTGATSGAWNEPVQVGGNRYGWFAANELPVLAFDNATLVVPEPATMSILALGGLLLRRKK